MLMTTTEKLDHLLLSRAAIICMWMESRPCKSPTDFQPWRDWSDGGWWRGEMPEGDPQRAYWVPRKLTLDALHEVEARLQAEARNAHDVEPCIRRNRYIAALSEQVGTADLWHASAEAKIAALAAVLSAIDATDVAASGLRREP